MKIDIKKSFNGIFILLFLTSKGIFAEKNSIVVIPDSVGITANSSFTEFPDNPLHDARIVWHMKTLRANENYPLDLKMNGHVELGQKIEGDDYEQSLKRGGDGFVTSLTEQGYLSLDINRTKTLRSNDNAVSLYTRVWIGPEDNGTIFFSDFLTLAIHTNGLAIGFLGMQTPHGKVFREMPLCILQRGCWSDLIMRVGNGKLDFFSNGILINSIPVNQELCSPFDEELQIGAFMWSGPDLYEYTPAPTFRKAKIDIVALWNRTLSDKQVAFLSGVVSVKSSGEKRSIDQAILDYNAFFDASVNKDTASCRKLWKSLKNLANHDPWRPAYHLTQPFGWILDPAGAFYYEGRYHVFSYRNIFKLLRYCSLDHYISDDLVHWSEWPVGPMADSNLDVYGIWLMNHFIDDQGVPGVIYTGLGKQGKYGVLAHSSDGLVSYGNKKGVLTKYDHDGHVWKEGNTWYTIISRMQKGTRPGNLGDAVMLWTSPDLEHWQERGEIFTQPKEVNSSSQGDKNGFMEFPYLLSFGNKDVLMLGGHPVRYWVGRFDRQQLKFIPDTQHGLLLDYSNPFHCFNPLCVDQKGAGAKPRRIIMALYADLNGDFEGLPWYGVHAMPRLIELHGDHLCQEPVPEMKSLRGEHFSKRNIKVSPKTSGYISKHGDTVEIIADFEQGDASCFGLKVRLSQDGTSFVRIYFNTLTNEYGVDGSVPDTHRDLGVTPGQGRPSYIKKGQPVRMHVFLDKLLLETFVNGQTCTIAAKERNARYDGIDLFSEGGNVQCTCLEIWNMKRSN